MDSLADIAGAMNHTLARRGYPIHSVDAYRGFIGEGVENLVRRALPSGAADDVLQVLSEYRAHYQEHLFDSTAPYPGIVQLLASLEEQGVPMAVLSNKSDDATRRLVAGIFPEVPFADVRGDRPGSPRKPDPRVALELASRMGVSPSRCAFVGDSFVDVKTAIAAGMLPVGVLWGFRDEEELRAAGALHVLRAAAELLPLLRRPG